MILVVLDWLQRDWAGERGNWVVVVVGRVDRDEGSDTLIRIHGRGKEVKGGCTRLVEVVGLVGVRGVQKVVQVETMVGRGQGSEKKCG